MDKLEIKATLNVDDEGTITGIAWPFGSPDSIGDIITKGAFGTVPADLPMLFSHDPADLVGTWNEVAESDQGLTVKGKVHMDMPRARSVLRLVKSQLIGGLSIGFRAKSATGTKGKGRVISALDLAEVSLVRNPSHTKARILSAKANDSALAVAELIKRFTAALT